METPLRLGDIELVPLLDGISELQGTIEEKFQIPGDADLTPFRERYPALFTETSWRLHVRCTLIRQGARRILVDTGVGHASAPAYSWFGLPGRLSEELAAVGEQPSGIDTVVLTHVHDDHLGGTVEPGGGLAFPNARYVLQRADRDQQVRWASEDEEDRAIWEMLLAPLEAEGRLDLVDGETSLADEISLVPAPGHTPGHQMVEVRSDGQRIVISGDTVNHPMQVANPAWAGSSDDDPGLAAKTRWALIEALSGSDAILAPSHFAEPFGRVGLGPDGLAAWLPLTDAASPG